MSVLFAKPTVELREVVQEKEVLKEKILLKMVIMVFWFFYKVQLHLLIWN